VQAEYRAIARKIVAIRGRCAVFGPDLSSTVSGEDSTILPNPLKELTFNLQY
jgi:hypothetical protein